ncbi:hypothetical protein [Burkholderia savannae]|uniref:hypothetical protein n=1 Tax=Burkholderia savannae TaxID=1637837 RepID=UPI0012E358A5|nr:hypothetical protein [Burkholderia savannae]
MEFIVTSLRAVLVLKQDQTGSFGCRTIPAGEPNQMIAGLDASGNTRLRAAQSRRGAIMAAAAAAARERVKRIRGSSAATQQCGAAPGTRAHPLASAWNNGATPHVYAERPRARRLAAGRPRARLICAVRQSAAVRRFENGVKP